MPEPIFADEDICVDKDGNRVPCGSAESTNQRYAKGNIVTERDAARLGLAGGGGQVKAEDEREAKKASEIRDRQLKAAAQPAPREPEFRADSDTEAMDAGTVEDRLAAGERKAETAKAVGEPSATDRQAERLEATRDPSDTPERRMAESLRQQDPETGDKPKAGRPAESKAVRGPRENKGG